jgi:ribosomal protein S18 acetylase RimI-like enzyme
MIESENGVRGRNRATGFRIRQATLEDQQAIDSINHRAWSGGITTHELLEQRHGLIGGRPWVKHIIDAVAANLARPDVTAFVAEQDDRIVGYATAEIKQDESSAAVGIVGYNAVDPDFRGQGIGTALCDRVMSFLKEAGAQVLAVWTLESDAPARRIYERQGFEELTRFVYYSMEFQETT